MGFFKRILDFYIQSSIHVAFSAYALVRMTQHLFRISDGQAMAYFAFFGTILGYNFVKYDALARMQKIKMRQKLKAIAGVSFGSFIAVGYFFFQLQFISQLLSVAFLCLTLLYTLPFFPNRRNARNWAGVKIYIVAFCWVGVTLVLPILDAGIPVASDFYLKCVQRFLLVFVLILIFEIIDLKNDDPHLQTVPQQIGVRHTKILGSVLLIVFFMLEFLNSHVNGKLHSLDALKQLLFIFGIALMVAFFLLFSNEKKSKYYTSFWVESVPIIWWMLFLLF